MRTICYGPQTPRPENPKSRFSRQTALVELPFPVEDDLENVNKSSCLQNTSKTTVAILYYYSDRVQNTIKIKMSFVVGGRRRVKCDLCDKTLTNKQKLTEHINSVHLGLRPYRVRIVVCQKEPSSQIPVAFFSLLGAARTWP